MTYDEAKTQRAALDARHKAASLVLASFPKGALGMTTDAAKATPEWRRARRDYELAFGALRDFTRLFLRAFARESAADRAARLT